MGRVSVFYGGVKRKKPVVAGYFLFITIVPIVLCLFSDYSVSFSVSLFLYMDIYMSVWLYNHAHCPYHLQYTLSLYALEYDICT